MLKTILAGTTALVIAGASLAYAQKAPDGPGRAHGWRPSAQDMAAFGDARIAALHAGLKLTPDQEKNWPAVEAALRDIAKQRSERFAARASADKPGERDPIERLNLRAETMTQTGAALKKLADAAGPLYKSLDDGQKHRFMVLARFEGQRFERGMRGGHHGGRMHQHGPRGERGPAGPADAPKPQ